MFYLKHRTQVKQEKKIEIKIKTWIQIKNNCYGKGITSTVFIFLELNQNVPLLGSRSGMKLFMIET